jgi:hypothetical protein
MPSCFVAESTASFADINEGVGNEKLAPMFSHIESLINSYLN